MCPDWGKARIACPATRGFVFGRVALITERSDDVDDESLTPQSEDGGLDDAEARRARFIAWLVEKEALSEGATDQRWRLPRELVRTALPANPWGPHDADAWLRNTFEGRECGWCGEPLDPRYHGWCPCSEMHCPLCHAPSGQSGPGCEHLIAWTTEPLGRMDVPPDWGTAELPHLDNESLWADLGDPTPA